MAKIVNNILYSKEGLETLYTNDELVIKERFIHRVIKMINTELEESGDRDWLVDCLDKTSIRISQIENMAKRVASGLTKLGLGPGNVKSIGNANLSIFFQVTFFIQPTTLSLTSTGQCWEPGCVELESAWQIQT